MDTKYLRIDSRKTAKRALRHPTVQRKLQTLRGQVARAQDRARRAEKDVEALETMYQETRAELGAARMELKRLEDAAKEEAAKSE